MGDWTKVLLYGTYDGFTRSTDGLHRIVVVLEGGERVEIPKEFVVSAEQMVNKNKIKLKDVIARIKSFDVESQKAWLNEILNELGSDYRALIYKDGYEQGKLEGLIEREIVTVPRFVADWYEEHKDNLEYNIWDWMKYNLEPKKRENAIFSQWLGKTVNNPVETLIKMKLYGYEVEKEKQYEVILCNGQSLKTVYRQGNDRLDFEKVYGDLEKFTRKQLEDAGFGWMFDCPGMEVREVE